MDTRSIGSFRLSAFVMQVALIAMSASLGSCAQPAADAQVPKEKTMQRTPPTEDDIRAEQDRVAALVDQAAVKVGGQTAQGPAAADPTPFPKGPALNVGSLEAGIVRLATDLRGPEQTSPEFVAQVFGAALGSDGSGKRMGVRGALDASTYLIEVETLYPGTPGRHVSVLIEPAGAKRCVLNYEQLVDQLEKAGYQGKRAPRGLDPSMNFSRDLGPLKGFVELDLNSYDEGCIWQISFDLENHDG